LMIDDAVVRTSRVCLRGDVVAATAAEGRRAALELWRVVKAALPPVAISA
jgi:hypothetical protein